MLPILSAALACLPASSGLAQAASGDGEPSWIPYIGASFDSGEEVAGASITSTVGVESRGKNSFDHTRFRFETGILTPSWTSLPGRPRFFIQGGIDLHSAGSERPIDVGKIAGGTAIEDEIDVLIGILPDLTNAVPEDIPGQGQYIRQEYMGPAWVSAIGVSFEAPAPWDDGSIRIKPLAAYEGERIRIEGRFANVRKPDPLTLVVDRAFGRDNPTTDHRVGVGAEIELLFFQGERVEISTFGSFRYLWLISGRGTKVSDPTGIALFEWRQDANVVRGGLGIRIGWRAFGR